MPRIRILPDQVANQIAAGEVIERPAAVVKELIENALDAGATRISVEFEDGGRALLRVEDNGHGMARDDALLSLERHATSKIADADDLNRLSTYGFRGEALPSIASISKFTLQTRTAASDAGTEVLVNAGKLLHVRECGRSVGTTISVAQLFHPVPARRKFMKSDATEAAHIAQCVRLYALACPGVAFTLREDGRIVFRSPECPSLLERVAEIFGQQTAQPLLAIDSSEPGLKLTGLVGRPGTARSTRHEMITFVNGRPVESRTLGFALAESYRESVPKGRYPVAFIFLECDPSAVDVNVHPAKREVRFRSDAAVRGFIIRSVLERLREAGEASAPEPTGRLPPGGVEESPPSYGSAASAGPESAGGAPLAGAPAVPVPVAAALPPARDTAGSPVRPDDVRTPLSWRLLGVAHGAYAVFETSAGLVILDRAAASERVWFERLQEQFRAGSVASQALLLPVALELDPIASALLLERLPFLRRHGFHVGEFGRGFFRIESVPSWLDPSEAERLLRDVLGACREGRIGEDTDLARDELARIAARAVRLPAAPAAAELHSLLGELFATRSPLTSPAGRPTLVEVSRGELSRWFQKR